MFILRLVCLHVARTSIEASTALCLSLTQQNECAATRGNSPARAMAKGEPLPVRKTAPNSHHRANYLLFFLFSFLSQGARERGFNIAPPHKRKFGHHIVFFRCRSRNVDLFLFFCTFLVTAGAEQDAHRQRQSSSRPLPRCAPDQEQHGLRR